MWCWMDYCDLRYGPAAMLVDTNGTFWFIKKWDLPWLTEQLLAVLCVGWRERELTWLTGVSDWAVGKMTKESRLDFWQQNDIFLLPRTPIPALCGPPPPPVQLVLGVKWLGHEASHSYLSSARVKNVWRCTSTSHYTLIMWCLIEDKESCSYI